MKFTSAGKPIDPRTLSYRSLGFGEAVSLETTPYELILEHSDFPQHFLECADTFISECRTDDLEQGFADIPGLERLNYPTFQELLESQPEVAAALIDDYLYFELFFALFRDPSPLALVINSLTSTSAKGRSIILVGETFAARQV